MAERFPAGARVGDVRESIVRKAATIGSQSSVPELLEKILEDPRSRHVFVVDEDGVLTGSVRLNSVIRHLFPYVTGTALGGKPWAPDLPGRPTTGSVAHIMNKNPRFVTDETSIVGTVRLMEEEQINELPVVDEKRLRGRGGQLPQTAFNRDGQDIQDGTADDKPPEPSCSSCPSLLKDVAVPRDHSGVPEEKKETLRARHGVARPWPQR